MAERHGVTLFCVFVTWIAFIQCEAYSSKSLTLEVNSSEGLVLLMVPSAYKDKNVSCYQSTYNLTSDAMRIEIPKMAYDPHTKKSFFKKLSSDIATAINDIFNIGEHKPFTLQVKKEGYLWCEVTETQVIRSNIVFFLDLNKHVIVMKLNQELPLKELQDKIDNRNLMVLQLSSDKTVFHLTNENSTTDERIILQQVRDLLHNKLDHPLQIEYVRSTVFCPSYEKYKLPSIKLPFNTKVATDIGKYCEGDFYTGAYWDEAQLKKISLQQIEDLLRPQKVMKLKYSSLENKGSIDEFSDTLESLKYLKPNEVKIVTRKFNLLLTGGEHTLKEDNETQETSNRLLASLEKLLMNTSLASGEVQEEQENIAVRVEDITRTGTVGVLVSDNFRGGNKTFEMRPLNRTFSTDDVLQSLPRVGIQLPPNLLRDFSTPTKLLVTAIRRPGLLFKSRSTSISSIISATLEGKQLKNLSEPVLLYFARNVTKFPEKGICVFWDIKADNKTGAWSREGCMYTKSRKIIYEMYLDECHCNHLTYFAAIFSRGTSDIGEQNEQNLKIISLVGCSVSLVSLCGVFINATFSKKWLRGPGQKILLQMAINLAMLLIMFLVAAYAKAPGIGCVVVGFFFHYTILSNFFWMAVAGYLQYYRLVKVLSSRTSKLVLKTTIVGWGVPIIPGVVVLAAGKYNSGAPLCLPVDGWAFYATILAPICLVLVLNIGIFIMIFKNLYMTTKPRQHVDRCISIRRFKQLAFLFTLLGLNWIFGVCHALFSKSTVLFAYLFSLMVTFQGLTYFVFFVLHERARNLWKTFIKCFVQSKAYNVDDLTMDTATSTISQSN